MLTLLLAVGLAVLISAFCSVAEAVLYSVPWTHIENLRKQGRKSGRLLADMRQDIERPISAILTLNTIANTAGASIAGAAAANVYGSDILGVFAALFTLVILIFSEILPKTFGVAYCRVLAPAMAQPLYVLVRLSAPVIWITGSLARLVRPKKRSPSTTEEDIRALVAMTRRHGIIEPYEEVVIRNILSLDLKTVEQIMTPRTVVFSLPASMNVGEAHAQKRFLQHSRMPVYGEDGSEDIVGMVYRRAILEALASDQDNLTLDKLMRPARFVPENLSLDRLLAMFLESRAHLFVVLDEYGGLSGVVSLEDVLEEILGREIVDETDGVADLREYARVQRRAMQARREANVARNGNGKQATHQAASATASEPEDDSSLSEQNT